MDMFTMFITRNNKFDRNRLTRTYEEMALAPVMAKYLYLFLNTDFVLQIRKKLL